MAKGTVKIMLEQQIIPQIRESYGAQFDNVWWMQDGAPCHRRVLVLNYLSETFQNRIIGFGFEREWPPRSPDLTPCDFFLWRHLKINPRCTALHHKIWKSLKRELKLK